MDRDFALAGGTFLVLFSLYLIVGLRRVPVRQLLVIYHPFTGRVRAVLAGPTLVGVLPVVQSEMRVDRSIRQLHLQFPQLSTRNQLSICGELDLFITKDLTKIKPEAIEEILPWIPDLENIVMSWASYVIQALAAGYCAGELLEQPGVRARLERQFMETLTANVAVIGVQVKSVRLLLHPSPKMQEIALEAQSRLQMLAAAQSALGQGNGLEKVLTMQVANSMMNGRADVVAAVNLPNADHPAGFPSALPTKKRSQKRPESIPPSRYYSQ